MHNVRAKVLHTFRRSTSLSAIAILSVAVSSVWMAPEVSANHPVLVEGNCNNPPAGNPGPVPPGTCGDYDGDGRIGTAEDMDGDRVFGTINAANGPAGVSNNGTITIVTSGTFPEVVVLAGNVTLEAAPGVNANVDAVLQGDAASTARQGTRGILVNALANRFVVIRNITSKNWTVGIQVEGNSNVLIENCRVENNINYGILVQDTAKVKIADTTVAATGFRLNPTTGDFPTTSTPDPGVGIAFEGSSSGLICNTCVTGSYGAGIRNTTRAHGGGLGISSVNIQNVCVFNNQPDLDGIRRTVGN